MIVQPFPAGHHNSQLLQQGHSVTSAYQVFSTIEDTEDDVLVHSDDLSAAIGQPEPADRKCRRFRQAQAKLLVIVCLGHRLPRAGLRKHTGARTLQEGSACAIQGHANRCAVGARRCCVTTLQTLCMAHKGHRFKSPSPFFMLTPRTAPPAYPRSRQSRRTQPS